MKYTIAIAAVLASSASAAVRGYGQPPQVSDQSINPTTSSVYVSPTSSNTPAYVSPTTGVSSASVLPTSSMVYVSSSSISVLESSATPKPTPSYGNTQVPPGYEVTDDQSAPFCDELPGYGTGGPSAPGGNSTTNQSYIPQGVDGNMGSVLGTSTGDASSIVASSFGVVISGLMMFML